MTSPVNLKRVVRSCFAQWRRPLTRALVLCVAVVLCSIAWSSYITAAAPVLRGLPDVYTPYNGDPRLEPIPTAPMQLDNLQAFTTDQFGVEKILDMRFPPRANGQNQSDGDKHADLYILFDEAGVQVNQPVILEAVPKGAAAVSDLQARLFSPIWEITAVIVGSDYDASNLSKRIDSAAKVFTSSNVKKIIQTNIFVNCPVVPRGTTVAAGSSKPEDAFFEGNLVSIVPYDIEDGGFNVQILYKFEDRNGNTLGRSMSAPLDGTPLTTMMVHPAPGEALPTAFMPHLVATHSLGDPDYTSLWDVQTIVVPYGAVSTINSVRSNIVIKAKLADSASGWSRKSSTIRLNCPVVAVTAIKDKKGVAISPAVRVPVPVEDWRQVLTVQTGGGGSTFMESKFPFDIPVKAFTKSRTFQITEVSRGGNSGSGSVNSGSGGANSGSGKLAVSHNSFPDVTPEYVGKGNVIPIILQNPYQTRGTSGPATNGPFFHMKQSDIDAGVLGDDIEANFSRLIANGNLAPEWALGGGHSFQERLAVVGRAYFELFWRPEDGGNANDVTSCLACHSMPSSGGSARGLYNLERAIGGSAGTATKGNAGSAFGSGSASELVRKMIAQGLLPATVDQVTNRVVAPGTLAFTGTYRQGPRAASGSQASNVIRADVAGASNTHFGIQSVEFILGKVCPATGLPVTTVSAALECDLDLDGVKGEKTVGDVTAEAVFLLTLSLPDQADDAVKDMLGITDASLENGRKLFRGAMGSPQGGIGCASCHTPFIKFDASALNVNGYPHFQLTAPDESNHQQPTLDLQLPFHVAEQEDVDEHLADWVGQRGLRTYGDFKQHKIGCDSRLVQDANGNPIPGINPLIEAPATVSFFTTPAGGSAAKASEVWNLRTAKSAELWDVGSAAPLFRTGSVGSDLKAVILAHGGPMVGSCDAVDVLPIDPAAIASRNAFKNLSDSQQQDVVNFLRMQTIQSKVGEGSGAIPPRPVVAVP